MAKLSEVNQNPMDSLESLKRRYQRQNRELAKANANQAQQIQALQQEISLQNAENIRLNAQVIQLKNELDSRDAKTPFNVADSTKRLLEEKMSELTELIKGLGDGGSGSSNRRRLSAKYFPKAVKPERERQEAYLDEIPENEYAGHAPASPDPSAPKRREASLESPSKGGYIPLDSAMFDIRPRRRRDSSTPDNLASETVPPPAEDQNLVITSRETNKRKYPDINQDFEDRIIPPRLSDLEEVMSSPITAVEEPARGLPVAVMETKEHITEMPPASSPVKLDISSASKFVSIHRKSLENVNELKQAQSLAPTESRRILEPKSTNGVSLNNSPVKLPTAADFEYIKKEMPIPKDRDPMKKAARITGKPIIIQGVENTLTPEKGTERNRRTRGVAVNYALPALNKKMRRETETLVDAVTGIQPKRRSVSTGDDLSRDTTPAATPASRTVEERKSLKKIDLEDLERRASKMTIHQDSKDENGLLEKRNSFGTDKALVGLSDRDIRKMVSERTTRERDLRLEEARKDIYEFTMSSSPDQQPDLIRRTSSDRKSLGAGTVGSSHSRRTSAGATTASHRKEGELRASSSSSTSLKSATELLEERRKRRATLGGATTSATSSLAAEGSRKSVSFADHTQDSRVSSARDGRRKSMLI